MNKLLYLLVLVGCWQIQTSCAQTKNNGVKTAEILTGADQTGYYLPILKGKRVALFANPTSVIGKTHLLDSLIFSKINVVVIFGPEHGFRGKADAGEHVNNDVDAKTGIPVISLYGDHKKPTAADLKNVDVMLFDIQDVGVRYYTFISSLQYYMEAAIENEKELIILDRPNPNGFYVDGPVLDTAFKSFVGMQPIPIVYGLTIGEYAKMLLGEKWLDKKCYPIPSNSKFKITIVPCKNYTHDSKYILPVNPSPNLKEIQSIYLYPSICFFEGTVMSEGRGTDKPFQIFGHPNLPSNLFSFTPKPNDGAKNSKCFNQVCYGWNVSGSKEDVLKLIDNKIQIKYLLEAYKLFPGKDSFFLKNNFFNKLAGNNTMIQQIKSGKTEAEIRKSWEPELTAFKAIRKKYLLYKDFKQD
jgi:uncharacterized protein YbbC (DUF1343 family)